MNAKGANPIIEAVEGGMSHFNISSLMLQQIENLHELNLVLSELVQFLILRYKVACQLLGTLAKSHIPQIPRANKCMQNNIKDIRNKFKASTSQTKQ